MTDSDTGTFAYSIKVATPTANPLPGTYSSTQNVALSCSTAGATIRYTTDGSEPTSSSTLYSSPISVSSTMTIKAKAFKASMTDSDTGTFAYTITAGGMYSLVFDSAEYIFDFDFESTGYITAYVLNSLGNIVTAPTLVSIVYTTEHWAESTTGEFEFFDLWPYYYRGQRETYVTATATLSNGTILQEDVRVETIYAGKK
jgi:hypothetical protein